MKAHGIQISDSKDNVLTIKLSDILEEVKDGIDLHWAILFLDGVLKVGVEESFEQFNKINTQKTGFKTDFKGLFLIDQKFHQVFEVVILGCKNYKFLHRYEDDQEMHQSCDIVIELIDCAFWQVFSKDEKLINNLCGNFKEVELLD